MQIYLRKSCEKMDFDEGFCKSGRYSANLCLRISKKSSNFAAKLRWWSTIINNLRQFFLQ